MKKLLLSVFFLVAVFTGCKKEETDYSKLEGTLWEAETDETLFSLHFVDGSICTLTTARNDNSDSANRITYTWRYRSDVDSMWGLFFVRAAEGNGGFQYAGTIENKTLYLSRYDTQSETLAFKRK